MSILGEIQKQSRLAEVAEAHQGAAWFLAWSPVGRGQWAGARLSRLVDEGRLADIPADQLRWLVGLAYQI